MMKKVIETIKKMDGVEKGYLISSVGVLICGCFCNVRNRAVKNTAAFGFVASIIVGISSLFAGIFTLTNNSRKTGDAISQAIDDLRNDIDEGKEACNDYFQNYMSAYDYVHNQNE